MQVETSTLIAVGLPTIGAIVWLVRLEGRINLSDRELAHITKTLDEIKTDVKKIRHFMGGGVER